MKSAWVFLLFGVGAWAADSVLDVHLFGSPCKLKGPREKYDTQALQNIHDISPASIPIIQNGSDADRAFKILDAPKKTPPKELSTYISAMKDYVRKFSEYFAALGKARDSGQSAAFQKFVHTQIKSFRADRDHQETLEKNLSRLSMYLANKKTSPSLEEALLESYREILGPPPEQNFHSTLRTLGIEYHCSMEGSGAGE